MLPSYWVQPIGLLCCCVSYRKRLCYGSLQKLILQKIKKSINTFSDSGYQWNLLDRKIFWEFLITNLCNKIWSTNCKKPTNFSLQKTAWLPIRQTKVTDRFKQELIKFWPCLIVLSFQSVLILFLSLLVSFTIGLLQIPWENKILSTSSWKLKN